MKNKGSLHIWCVGYWLGGRFKVPQNLYHLKFGAENSFLFLAQISEGLPDYDWKLISERERNELVQAARLDKCLPVCSNEIENDGQKETKWDFGA